MLSKRTCGIGVCALLVAVSAGAQDQNPPPRAGVQVQPQPAPQPVRPAAPPAAPAVGPDQSAPAGHALRAKQILGSKVRIEQDAQVGTVDDLVIDEHGNVDYVLVLVSDGQYVTVPWDAVQFNAEDQIAHVEITLDRFKAIPTYTAERYPVFTAPSYRAQTYQFFGLTPGQQRRMIRRSTR